jgi:chaperonin cofactor prefoldin
MIQLFFIKLLKTIFGVTSGGKKVNVKRIFMFLLLIFVIGFAFYVKTLKDEVTDLNDKNSQMSVQLEQANSRVKDLNDQLSKFKSSEVIDNQVSDKVISDKSKVSNSKTVIKQKLIRSEQKINSDINPIEIKEKSLSEVRIDAITEAYQLALNSSEQSKGT